MKKLLLIITTILFTVNLFAQTPITATIPFQGYDELEPFLGEGEYEIFMDTTDNVLDKVIYIIDGFDPGDTRGTTAIYAGLIFEGQHLGNTLRSEGFDFVVVNFPVYTRAIDNVEVDGGTDFIQRNAFILAEIITQINALKVGNEQSVVIGPSMGGLISRYALRYMEMNGMDHETRLYISIDSPHLGANIPMGFQYLLNYFADQTNDDMVQALLDSSLNSPASKQMLIDHYLGHLLAGSTVDQDPNMLLPVGAPNFRDAFQNELNTMGFPQQTRNIATVNGSGLGTPIGTPGANVLDHTFDLGNGITSDIVINFTPAANQTNQVTGVEVFTQILPPPFPPLLVSSYGALSESPSTSSGLDSAPGGKADFLINPQGSAILQEFIDNLNQTEHCFIPTISALAITNEPDWYAVPDIGNTHDSEFVSWYIPDTNEGHVDGTQESIDFILPEIRNGVLSIDQHALHSIKLKTNPVTDFVTLQVDNSIITSDLEVQIVTITGKKVFDERVSIITNEVRIPIQLENGIYLLSAQNDGFVLHSKLIVKN